ncbi:MAG: hypothetical protein ACREO8_03935, partial [Luteimonas sp.]
MAHVCVDDAQARALIVWVDANDIDAAIEHGLMQFVPCPACAHADPGYPGIAARLDAARCRLADAWAARERYRARQTRLAQRATEHAARRTAPALPTASAAVSRPALPPAAAAALARAK